MLAIIVKNDKRNYLPFIQKDPGSSEATFEIYLRSNFSDFFSPSFWHSGKQLSSILRAQSGEVWGNFPRLRAD